MDEKYFSYQEGELFCEGVKLSRLCQLMGTPLWVYSASLIRDRFRYLKNAFLPLSPLICYSLKANANLSICRLLSSLGAGADIVSGGELYRALLAGFSPQKIVFAGVGKREEEIEFALREGILMFTVESESELVLIERIASRLKKEAPISLRINPDIESFTHNYITTGKKENKFGLSFETAKKLYQKLKKNFKKIKTLGVHTHIGSQILSLSPYLEVLKKLVKFVEELKQEGVKISWLDLGGGFGIPYRDESPFPLTKLAQETEKILKGRNLKLILEPGRYIVGEAGALLTRVLYRKKRGKKIFLIVDAGMNDLIRPSLYHAYHKILKLKVSGKEKLEKVDVVGPVCESGDFFSQNRKLPFTCEGEGLGIMDTGAYGFSMSSQYNSRPRGAEVLVEGKEWKVAREREDFLDLTWREIGEGRKIEFLKLEANGNEFVVVDNRGEIIKDRAGFSRRICAFRKGVGADGALFLEDSKKADFKMRIFNPDGSEAEMCGNGARCISRFALLKGVAPSFQKFQTLAGIISAEVRGERVKVKMSEPHSFSPHRKINLEGKLWEGHFINTGVPHFILFFSPLKEAPVEKVGRKIRFHPEFLPRGTNVDFVEREREGLKMRTYERGVERETLSCGTGAVGCALVGSYLFDLPSPVEVETGGGKLRVYFKREGKTFKEVFLEGEAKVVFRGEIEI